MTAVRTSFNFAVDIFTSGMWGLAAFFLGSRFLSTEAGALIGFGVFVTALTFILTSRHQEKRARSIVAGLCPRCGTGLESLHEHRRWDTATASWLAPAMSWQCPRCDFQQDAALACERCPEPVTG